MQKELDIKNELLETSNWLHSKEGETILTFLKKMSPELRCTFILHHHYGQTEEYFTIIVNGNYIVEIETADEEIVSCEKYEINSYIKENSKMPRSYRRRIEIAKKLSNQ